MEAKFAVSRRGFVGGVATAVGALTLAPDQFLLAQSQQGVGSQQPVIPGELEYDGYAKLAANENPWGPPDSVMQAMTHAMKYSNRYGYPDGGLVGEIARHHGVRPDMVMIAAGSGEILDVVGSAFASNGKKVVGVEPTYSQVYQHVTGVKGAAITLPLREDFSQDIPALVRVTRRNYRDVGFVYICNPNNPTGKVVPKQDIQALLDGIPEDTPVLIDEAYHHFVEDPSYATSVPYVLEGRPVIVARTFSKIAALAGMRLGYAIAPRELIQQMRPFSTGTINAMVKHGGVAALRDTAAQARVKQMTLDLRKKHVAQVQALGYSVIPSETNFFMIHIKRPVQPVIQEFQKKGVLVGRPFPPMTDYLRVSVGTAAEMERFQVAFKDILGPAATLSGRGGGGARR
jgi:histidinol-phosphate aminotransferase